ncbi:MAG: multicopper oxidase domain-containing protein [Bacteroidota bacterium]|nr:multicopper oxidase domain-containing protein [Bacteroidota bacterium]
MRSLWKPLTFVLISMYAHASDTLAIRHIDLKVGSFQYPVTVIQGLHAMDSTNAPILISDEKEISYVILNSTDRDQVLFIEDWNWEREIKAGQYATIHFPSPEKGTWVRMNSKDEGESYAGLSTVVGCPLKSDGWFYWNLKSYERGTLERIRRQESFSIPKWPSAFTFNNRGFPQTRKDTLAVVKGHVGDTLHIVVLNSSSSHHSLHFHGYHVRILKSTCRSMEGWLKDTFPLFPGEIKVLELVPHQPGMYPVHDHNLVSVTMDGNYPGGMITMLMIMP